MAFGAMFVDQTGNPFYIDGTLPLTLLEHRQYNVSAINGGQIDLYRQDDQIRFVFVNSTAGFDERETCELIELFNGMWTLRYAGSARTIHVYIFGYQFQNPSGWGFQINDAQGRCVLTHETKVLRDIRAFGDMNDNNNSGMTMNTTVNGNWAVAPIVTGYFVGIINQGNQPRPAVARYISSARTNGSQTRFRSGYLGNPEQGASNVTITNFRSQFYAIDVNRY